MIAETNCLSEKIYCLKIRRFHQTSLLCKKMKMHDINLHVTVLIKIINILTLILSPSPINKSLIVLLLPKFRMIHEFHYGNDDVMYGCEERELLSGGPFAQSKPSSFCPSSNSGRSGAEQLLFAAWQWAQYTQCLSIHSKHTNQNQTVLVCNAEVV